jgi:hypothetical protein
MPLRSEGLAESNVSKSLQARPSWHPPNEKDRWNTLMTSGPKHKQKVKVVYPVSANDAKGSKFKAATSTAMSGGVFIASVRWRCHQSRYRLRTTTAQRSDL